MKEHSPRQIRRGRPLPRRSRFHLPRKIFRRIANRFELTAGTSTIGKLGQELEITRITLRSALRDLAIANEGRKAIAEEVRCANDLSRSLRRELDSSREELHRLQLRHANMSGCRQTAARHVAGLTMRQRQVMDLVIAGHPSKIIATDLGISQRTVESHRAAVMRKTGSKSLPALVRTALTGVCDVLPMAERPPPDAIDHSFRFPSAERTLSGTSYSIGASRCIKEVVEPLPKE